MSIYTITLNPGIDLEYTVDEFKYNEVIRAVKVRRDLGGKGFNVSHALAKLGHTSTALGFVGGFSGKFLEAQLLGLGIKTDLTWIGSESRINTMIMLMDYEKHIKVNEPGAIITREEISNFEITLSKYCKPGNWIIISGSLPAGITNDYYLHLINLIQSESAKAVLDTSGLALAQGVLAKPYLIKPNLLELAGLTGIMISSRNDCLDAINVAHKMGAENICLTLGKDGAIYSDGKEVWSTTPPLINERNAIAAGDAFLAGLVSGLSDNFSNPHALALGTACGAAAASLEGTAFGDNQKVEFFLDKVKITKLH